MRRIKFTSVLLSILFTISLIAQIPVMAEQGVPTITIQSASGSPGTIVDVDVTIKDNPGVLGANCKGQFDIRC